MQNPTLSSTSFIKQKFNTLLSKVQVHNKKTYIQNQVRYQYICGDGNSKLLKNVKENHDVKVNVAGWPNSMFNIHRTNKNGSFINNMLRDNTWQPMMLAQV